MRLSDRLSRYRNRKQALNNVADYYIAVERQRQLASAPQPDAQAYVLHAPGAPLAPGDTPATNFDPMRTYAPAPPTNATTEADPALAASVDQLMTDLDREDRLGPPAASKPNARKHRWLRLVLAVQRIQVCIPDDF